MQRFCLCSSEQHVFHNIYIFFFLILQIHLCNLTYTQPSTDQVFSPSTQAQTIIIIDTPVRSGILANWFPELRLEMLVVYTLQVQRLCQVVDFVLSARTSISYDCLQAPQKRASVQCLAFSIVQNGTKSLGNCQRNYPSQLLRYLSEVGQC